jgi:tRNA G10  N-methylase Trm11
MAYSSSPQKVREKRSISGTRAHSDDRSAWLIRCRAGLGSVALDELRFRKIISKRSSVFTLKQRDHDLILLAARVERPPSAILRIPEQVLDCLAYGRYKISNAQIARLANKLKAEQKRFRIAVTAAGTHFVRQDFERYLERELRSHGVVFSEASKDLLWVFCIDEAYYIGLERFHASQAPGRVYRVVERPGSLPPTIAAAMAFLGIPGSQEVVLDPVCGSGTLLAEAFEYAGGGSFVGVDLDPEAIYAAQKNLAHIPQHKLVCGDGTRTDLPPHSVTLFLANLPFGKQFGDKSTNASLYRSILSEMIRLGSRDGWRAVLLSSDTEAIGASFNSSPELKCRKSVRLKVRGEWAQIYMYVPT